MDDVVIYGDKKETKKNVIINNILTAVDLAFEPDKRQSRTRDIVRKVVLDEINGYYRYLLEIWPCND
jgi:hypothetical protein